MTTDALRITPALEDPRLSRANILPPLVSVVVTSYNYASYVLECLRSVAFQTWNHWECIVVDDCSNDESPAIIEAFVESSEAGGRFSFIRHATNGGQMEGFKTGIAHAKGVFVVLLDADDLLLEDFLETHVRAHLGRKPVAMTSTNQYQIDGQGQVISAEHLDHMSKGRFRYVRKTNFQHGFWIWATASSMMFRTDTLRLILEYQPRSFRICADYYIAHFANLIGYSLLIPTIHGCYRRHRENNFGSNPVLGALNSVGCMSKHPPHAEFRQAIVDHMLANKARFSPILGRKDFMGMLFKVGTWAEIKTAAKHHPDVLPGPEWKLFARYVLFRLSRLKRDKTSWSDKLEILDPHEILP